MSYTVLTAGQSQSGGSVASGGTLTVLSGAIAISVSAYSDGSILVSRGGVVLDTTLSAGSLQSISAGGSAQGTTIESGGGEFVSTDGEVSFATIESGGRQYVRLGGLASATVVDSGGYQYVSSSTAYLTLVASGGVQFVSDGGTAELATVAADGAQYVGSGGFSYSSHVQNDGFQILSGGTAIGTTIESTGIQFLSNNAIAVSAVINDGGSQEIGLYGAASATIVKSGGVELLYSGGTIDRTKLESGGAIDLTTFAYQSDSSALFNDTTDVLSIENASSSVELQLSGEYGNANFVTYPDGLGGTDVIFEGPPCFCRGTRILTQHGYIAIEQLAPGETVVSPWGEAMPIRWLGKRHIIPRQHLRPWDVHPVRIEAHAFGQGMPERPLILSPDHSVFQNGVLIPVRYLLNGASIIQMTVDSVEYWHLELDFHRAVLAEGLPTESYLDTGNRAGFEGSDRTNRYEKEDSTHIWKTRSFAPLRLSGPEVIKVREKLLSRLRRLGFCIVKSPNVRFLLDGRQAQPMRRGQLWEVRWRMPAKVLRLVSLSGVPREIESAGVDHRRLGVAVSALSVDGIRIPLDDVRFVSGWHDVEPNLRWTAGDASIDVIGARMITLCIEQTLPIYLNPDDLCGDKATLALPLTDDILPIEAV